MVQQLSCITILVDSEESTKAQGLTIADDASSLHTDSEYDALEICELDDDKASYKA